MNTNYQRVIPRDFFNESKLLKCMGRLSLLLLDNLAPEGIHMIDTTEEGFKIALLDEGALTVTNVKTLIHGNYVTLKTIYNSKANYPFYAEINGEDVEVFDESGEFTEDFKNLVERLKN